MPEPSSPQRAETWLSFGSALAGLFSSFGCHLEPLPRVSQFALGLRLQLPRNVCVRFCLFRLPGPPGGGGCCSPHLSHISRHFPNR